MQISGKTHEGWMAIIPLAVLVFVVMVTLGGPSAFMNIVSLWATDVLASIAHWLKDL